MKNFPSNVIISLTYNYSQTNDSFYCEIKVSINIDDFINPKYFMGEILKSNWGSPVEINGMEYRTRTEKIWHDKQIELCNNAQKFTDETISFLDEIKKNVEAKKQVIPSQREYFYTL